MSIDAQRTVIEGVGAASAANELFCPVLQPTARSAILLLGRQSYAPDPQGGWEFGSNKDL